MTGDIVFPHTYVQKGADEFVYPSLPVSRSLYTMFSQGNLRDLPTGASSSNFRGIDIKKSPLIAEYLKSRKAVNKVLENNFVSIVGQIARVALCLLKVTIDDLTPDLGIMCLAKKRVIDAWAKWIAEHKSPATAASYSNQAKTGFRRLANWLRNEFAFKDGRRWVAKYERIQGKWEPVYYTIAEKKELCKDVKSSVDAVLAETARAAKKNLRHTKVNGQYVFTERYEAGTLVYVCCECS